MQDPFFKVNGVSLAEVELGSCAKCEVCDSIIYDHWAMTATHCGPCRIELDTQPDHWRIPQIAEFYTRWGSMPDNTVYRYVRCEKDYGPEHAMQQLSLIHI